MGVRQQLRARGLITQTIGDAEPMLRSGLPFFCRFIVSPAIGLMAISGRNSI
jgi:hypothetical protein